MKTGGFLKRTTPLNRGTCTLQSNTTLSKRSVLTTKSGQLRRSAHRTMTIKHKQIAIWTTDAADKICSAFIRKRDGCCQKCYTTYSLTNSHFHGRAHSATRLDPDNCDTFCVICHGEIETQKNPGEWYYEWKVAQLGQEKFDQLVQKARTEVKRYKAIIEFMDFINSSKENNDL